MSPKDPPQKRGLYPAAGTLSCDLQANIFAFAASVVSDIKAFSETSKDFHHASVVAGPRWWLVGALWQITAIESRRQGCGRIRHGSMSVALAFLDGMCLLANTRAHPHVRVLAVRTSLMLA